MKKIQPKVNDVMRRMEPDAVHMKGFVGSRFDKSRKNRLIHQEEDHLLWPFKEHCKVGLMLPNRPHPEIRGDWQGEYMGTWLDAAVLSAWNADDADLKKKIDAMVNEWLPTQEEDGYFGTYDGDERWESWDIWVHAHDIIGLVSYYRFSGEQRVLDAAIRAADCVLRSFGPGKRRVVETGPHMGMASSSFLEPLLWLYFETGDTRYLDFGKWLVDEDWEGSDGPKLVSSLNSGKGVARSGNAKGIEMLTNFVGLIELYRATGEKKYFDAVLNGWEDIVGHQLYITGSASTGEFFLEDYALHNDGVFWIGETCVSMGWLYFNLSMGRLTGEARFFDMAEQTLYNHLLAAQSPDGKG